MNRNLSGLRTLLYIFVLIALTVYSTGCSTKQSFNSIHQISDADMEEISEDMRLALLDFEVHFESVVINSANEIQTEATSREIDRNAGRYKSLVTKQIREYIFQEDGLSALLETWGYCIRLQDYFNSEVSTLYFGTYKSYAQEGMEEIIAEIESIAYEYLPESEIDSIESFLKTHAKDHPITGIFDDSEANSDPVQSTALQSFASTALSPFLTFKKVGQTSDSIAEFNQIASRIADIAEDLPRELRWESEHLMYTLLETDQILETLESLEEATTALNQMSETAANWPEDTKIAVRGVLEELETQKPFIEQTLADVRASSENIRVSLENANEVTANSIRLAETAQVTINESQEAIKALTAAANAVNETIVALQELQASGDPDAPKYTPEQVQQIAENVLQTAIESRQLIADVQQVESPPVVSDVQGRLESFSGKASQDGQAIVDYAFKRLIQFAVIVFILGIVLIIFARVMRQKSAS